MPNDNDNIFGDVIFSYTRAQAIEDGVLVDLTALAPDVCKQHFKFPVACTAAVYAIIDAAVKNKRQANDLKGVIHDILFMSRRCGRVIDDSTRVFPVIITGAARQRNFTFKIVCGPGDDAEPVMTISLPEED